MMMRNFLFCLLLLLSQCKSSDTVDPVNQNPEKDPVAEVQEDIDGIDALVETYMSKYNLPGISLAIAKNEKLVYLKGYGYANVEKKEKVNPDHVFRVASCSKAYTGLAIMKLVEEGKLKLSEKVFGEGAILGTKYGSKAYSENLKKITVSQLLHNTTGTFVDSKKKDLLNMQEELNNEAYLSWVLDNSFEEFPPGTAYHYVNVNYFVAAMIVEEISGVSFYDYLKSKVLNSINDEVTNLGISGVDLPNEAKYYGQGSLAGHEYDFNFERYVGSGNVVTNAKSLLKFATALDGLTERKDLLSPSLMKEFTTTTPHSSNWGHGLGVWGNRLYMYGSLPSTRAGWIFDKKTGLAAAIISNSNLDYTNPELDEEISYAQQDLLLNLTSFQRGFKNIDQF